MDNQTLRRYYASFMENMRLAEPLIWMSIKQRTISRNDFILAVGRWEEDIKAK